MSFVFLENNLDPAGGAFLIEETRKIVAARSNDEVETALKTLQDALNSGYHAAGFFSYELSYLLEPRLMALMPKNRAHDLLWFALSKRPQKLTFEEADRWLKRFFASPNGPHRRRTLLGDV